MSAVKHQPKLFTLPQKYQINRDLEQRIYDKVSTEYGEVQKIMI